MSMQTGENEQALRKILDMTRLISLSLLIIHFYYYGYDAFFNLGWTNNLSDRLLINMQKTGLFSSFHKSKLLALLFLIITLLGGKGRKNEQLKVRVAMVYIGSGFVLYFYSIFLLPKPIGSIVSISPYIAMTSIGFVLIMTGGTLLSRIIRKRLNDKDIFNLENETFPQEERLLENEYSVNLPARYKLKNKIRKSWINIINPFRGLIVSGTPGSGKSYFVIRHIITQHIQKGFSMFVYDFKYDDLTKIAYNT